MNKQIGTIQMIDSFDPVQLRYKLMGRHYRVMTKRGWAYTQGKQTAELLAKREEKPQVDPGAQIKANNRRIAEIDRERTIHLIRSVAWQLSKEGGKDSVENSMAEATQIAERFAESAMGQII